MKIIFLDIDGVLATHKQYMMNKKKFWDKNPVAKELKIPYPFDPKCVKVFNEILDVTGADIVLSSDWKTHWELTDIDKIFKFNGVKKSPIEFTTNDMVSFGNIVKNRAYQIGKYIQDHNITNYVVIDDLNISSFMSITNDQDKFVLTDDFEGIKKLSLKNKIIKILNNG
jgi:histidinol phosphatase-like enzyme